MEERGRKDERERQGEARREEEERERQRKGIYLWGLALLSNPETRGSPARLFLPRVLCRSPELQNMRSRRGPEGAGAIGEEANTFSVIA